MVHAHNWCVVVEATEYFSHKISTRYPPVFNFRGRIRVRFRVKVRVRVRVKDMVRIGKVFRVMAFFYVSVRSNRW